MRLIVAITVVAIVLLGALIVAVNLPARQPAAPLSAIGYSRSKAVEGFVDSSQRTTDPARLAAFTALANKYSIDLGHFDSSLNDVCTAGLTTDITLESVGATAVTLRIYDCGRTEPRGTFVSDASALITRWSVADGK